jgi:tetratricopeptide (TPR) repeat protein
MAIRGHLREASLADVLQLLALGQKTGVLSLACDQRFGSIHFGEGRVVFADVINWRDRLGDRLVRAGALEADALARLAADCPAGDDRAVAEAIAASGLVDRAVLEDACRRHVEACVYHLFTWTHGTFTFDAEPPGSACAPLLSISADALLLEGARRVDEWSLIERKVPSFDQLFELDAARVAATGAPLSPEQEQLRPWLDGTHDVNALIARTGLGEFEVGKALYGLITAGLVHRVGRSAARREPPPESRVAEHRNLGIAFYRTGLYAEAEREFRRVLELRATDATASLHLGLVHLRRGEWASACAVLEAVTADPEARGAAFHALAYALERLGRLDEAEAALEAAAARGAGGDPRLALSRAAVALARGALGDAEVHLATARDAWGARQPSAAWFHLAGLVAALAGDHERAAGLLEAGVGVHPHAAVLHNNLAVVQERRGRHELAARTIEHALLQDASLPQLHKNLGDYLYRAQRYDEAREAFGRVVRLAPGLGADVWLKLGNIHFRHGALDAAREAWTRALALAPDHRIAQANLRSLDAARGVGRPGAGAAPPAPPGAAREQALRTGGEARPAPEPAPTPESLFADAVA